MPTVPDRLHSRRTQASQDRPSESPAHRERQVIALALSWPTWGLKRLSLQLAREGIELSPSAYRLLRRVGLGTRSRTARRARGPRRRQRRPLDSAYARPPATREATLVRLLGLRCR